MQRSFRSRFDRIRSNITWPRLVVAVLVLLLAVATRVAYLLWPEWTGFGEKTLWDLLELLIIPAVLAFGALWFNQAARASEQKIATDQQRETALQNYLDKMAELLLKEKLLEKKDNPDDPVVDVAQVRTVTTLRILDRNRKNVLFQFLRDANLADFILVKASLANADLSYTSMYDIDLRGAVLSEANLSIAVLGGADLSDAYLYKAVLSRAYLASSNLSGAYLIEANLRGAVLSEANLSRTLLNGADLRWAYLASSNLSGAYLIEANLRGAVLSEANLREADLTMAKYNSQTKWPEGFDYENSGAILGDE